MRFWAEVLLTITPALVFCSICGAIWWITYQVRKYRGILTEEEKKPWR